MIETHYFPNIHYVRVPWETISYLRIRDIENADGPVIINMETFGVIASGIVDFHSMPPKKMLFVKEVFARNYCDLDIASQEVLLT